jgi:hypothetical protein
LRSKSITAVLREPMSHDELRAKLDENASGFLSQRTRPPCERDRQARAGARRERIG